MLQARRKTTVTPFWNRFPQFFLYPFKPAALAVMLGLVVLFAILPISLVGWLLRLVLAVFFVKYLYEVLIHASEGSLEPPPLKGEVLSQGYELPFKQLAIFIVLGLIHGGMAQGLGSWAAWIFSMTVNIALSASIMVLAMTSSLRSALNPGQVFGLIARVGWPYLALIGLQMLLSGGSSVLAHVLEDRVSPHVQLAVVGFSFMYFSVISFNLMGYVLYQYHEKLGFRPLLADDQDEHDPELERFQHFVDEQKYAAALEELRDVLSRRWGELELHRQAHKLAKLIQDHPTLVRHGRQYIEVLLQGNRVREAMDIYRDLVAVEPGFRPDRPEQYLPIAQMLRDSRQPKQAVGLINGFHKRFPDSMEVPALYLLAARICHEDLGEDGKAAQILGFVSKQYPGHGLIGAVEHYRRVLAGGQQPA